MRTAVSHRTHAAWRFTACLCALLGLAAISTTPAVALTVHVYKSSFGEPGSGPGQLEQPNGVAVNDSTSLSRAAGDVYVVDSKNNRVERFSATGEYLGEFDGGGTYEVEGKTETGVAAPTGAFSDPTRIAVDNSNSPLDESAEDVYVIDQNHAVVDKFTAAGEYLGQIDGSETALGHFDVDEAYGDRNLFQIAVDPKGTLWIGIHETGFAGSIPTLFDFNDEASNRLVSEVTLGSRDTPGLGSFGVDGEDDFYAPDKFFLEKYGEKYGYSKFGKNGELLQEQFGGLLYPLLESKGVIPRMAVVDAAHREVYLDISMKVEAFGLAGEPIESDESGAPLPSFGSGEVSNAEGFPSWGLAVNEGTGWVYATNQSTHQVAVFEAITLPGVALAAPSGRGTRGATLNGTVDPEGGEVTACVFEYDTRAYGKGEGPHGSSVPCSPAAAELGDGTSPAPVSASLSGLTPESVYYYRLVVSNAGDTVQTPGTELFTGPRLSDEYAVNATSTGASLDATVDPDGADTHYYFEYGPTTGYGSYAPASPPGGDLGEVSGAQRILLHLAGLTPGTSYHYRLVAVQDGEAFTGPDRGFSTEMAGVPSTIADGRHWELVSPASKGGALLEPNEQGGDVQAAADGSGLTYLVVGPPSVRAAGSYKFSQLLSRRGASGWGTSDLTLPRELPENGAVASQIGNAELEYDLFSPDLSLAAVEPPPAGTPSLSPQVGERTVYLLDTRAGQFAPLVGAFDTPEGTTLEEPSRAADVVPAEWQVHITAATPDLAHVVIESPKALTPEAIDDETVEHHSGSPQRNLYEWGDGQLQLVNVLPDEAVAHGHGLRVALAGEYYAGIDTPEDGPARNVSVDGRRIAWTWGETPYLPGGGTSEGFGGLYVRDMVEGRTVRVGGASALYETMNADGSKIFYVEGGDLHLFEFESGTDVDLTAAHGPEADAGVQKYGLSDVSEDGSYVYFVATGVLGEAGNGAGAKAVAGADNLYLVHDTPGGWTTTFVAQLSPEDRPSWESGGFSDEAPELGRVASRVSPNGRYLVFMSDRALTGYDNADAVSGQPDEEVYEYDALMGRLVCASCNPTGVRPHGVLDHQVADLLVDRYGVWDEKGTRPGDPHSAHWLAGSVPGWDEDAFMPTEYQPRYLSDSGRVFFDSSDSLVAGDTNGLEDVYEFEPRGIGGCTQSTFSSRWVFVGELAGSEVDGCVGLISSGTSGSESAFYDASENGDDVFFDTTSRLSAADYDTAYDIYDAHVCTSTVPCMSEPVGPPPCTSGDACKPPPTPQPEFYGAPASQTFHGIGNPTRPASAGASAPGKKRAVRKKKAVVKGCTRKSRRRGRLVCKHGARRAGHSRGASRFVGREAGR